jgi:hypothetical protein
MFVLLISITRLLDASEIFTAAQGSGDNLTLRSPNGNQDAASSNRTRKSNDYIRKGINNQMSSRQFSMRSFTLSDSLCCSNWRPNNYLRPPNLDYTNNDGRGMIETRMYRPLASTLSPFKEHFVQVYGPMEAR